MVQMPNEACTQLFSKRKFPPVSSFDWFERQLKLAFLFDSACSNLRCNECDFTVVQFSGKYVISFSLLVFFLCFLFVVFQFWWRFSPSNYDRKWSSSADYMFFRENVPNEAKLQARMEADEDFVAYACQCKWQSIRESTKADSCRVKWTCAGHS